MTNATGALVPEHLWERRERIAALLGRPDLRHLWLTSPYFRLAVSQLVDHIIPAIIRGAQVTRSALYAEDLAEDAAAAMVEGFAAEAEERDREHARVAAVLENLTAGSARR